MDVGCPKCQTEYELDDARVTEDGVTVKCTTCGHVFRVKKKQLVVTLPSRGDPPINLSNSGHSSELPPAPPSREWKLKQPSGNIFPCRDLTMLQKWIIEGKVSRDDQISLSGETWKRLGDIPELASFFQIVDDASKGRSLEAQQRGLQPPLPPGAKITDTWRGGQFSPPEPPPADPVQETLPPEPPAPRRPSGRTPEVPPPQTSSPPIMQTLQGGRFSHPPAPPLNVAVQSAARRAPEPSDEELRRAVGKTGGSGKWIALVLAGLLVGGGVGWYFGYYEPEQKRLIEARATEQARLDEEARVKALTPPQVPVEVLDASVEEEVAVDAGVADAGVEDAGVPDAGVPAVDAGLPLAPPVVVEQKKSFDWYLAQGDRLRERDKPEQALDFYGKAADLKPERVEPITGRGLALLDMANPSAAAATFETALKLNGRYGPAIMGLAEAFRIQGKNEKAVEFYQRYLEVLPDGAEAAVARNSIERLKK
ncbi:MAG: zinc-ribbon domain-containing protein [Archangium sp.]|nr:zinc-ribbon domain-containing protein [Archangium sp.]MDP3576243.1 zinc-ribbon domain-containing protein [Archangium sp.]